MSRRNIGSVALVLVSLTPVLFTIGWQAHQAIIRHEMKEELERKQLHSITLSPEAFRWINEEEIVINDRLFDVKVQLQNENGTVTFKGLFDEEETQLMEMVQKNMPDPYSQILMGKFFRIQLALPTSDQILADRSALVKRTNFPLYRDRLTSNPLNVIVPPPEA